jgi:hypothetical protein
LSHKKLDFTILIFHIVILKGNETLANTLKEPRLKLEFIALGFYNVILK